jgi:predicted RNA-binding Zn ribbon-like protein
MKSVQTIGPDWRDGFPFVANQLSLDFLNTQLVAAGTPVELLSDIRSLVRWLAAANLLRPEQVEKVSRRWENRPGVISFLDQLRGFRDRLRQAVFQWEAGELLKEEFIGELNQLLAQHPVVFEIERAGGQLQRRERFDPQIPEDTFGPLAKAAASLFSDTDPARVRKCESCVIHFYDTSKKGTRRWCSMQICGNKQKVAAYAQRQRLQKDLDSRRHPSNGWLVKPQMPKSTKK